MERQIPPEHVQVGMYVKRFSGSWFSHPFWRAHFLVKTPRDVERLRQSGLDYVVIDESRGLAGNVPSSIDPRFTAASVTPQTKPSRDAARRHRIGWAEKDAERDKTDRQRALKLLSDCKKVVRKAFSEARLGGVIRVADVAPIVDDVLFSIEHNPRALLKVLRLKKKNEYTYLHSVAVCTLMVNVAIHMGKGHAEVRNYGFAGLLHDVGKMGIPDSILDKAGPLTEEEFARIRNHSEYGYRILMQSADVPEAALDVCRHHHEKIDGSGYPFGLTAHEISQVALLGAICDVYDALTSQRVYKDAMQPAKALAAMWSWDGHFDRELLFTFMQSLGVYAPHMLVQLRSNRLGLVIEPARTNGRARVITFYATRERAWIEPEEVTIGDTLATDGITGPVDPLDWELGDHNAILERLSINVSAISF